MPGRDFLGPLTSMGHRPVYKANGFQTFLATIAVGVILSVAGVIKGGLLYDVLFDMTGAMAAFALVFCLFLYFKGVYFPSTPDSATTGNFVFDYFAGVELYPRVFGWDVKQFTNCRFGMMIWGLAPLSYAAKQYELYGFVSDSMIVSGILQLVYVAKFFWWETGYFETIDIMHDRAGFMLCWGCMVWVPCLYTITLQYLVVNPVVLGQTLSAIIGGLGLLSVVLNYHIDYQRQEFRKKKGDILTFGRPAQYIVAEYHTSNNQTHTSLLLTSGWWGMCRKLNYTLELSAAFCWSWPALFGHVLPYYYFLFLVLLLVDRAYRDDERCRSKYGKKWDVYCKQVPYLLIPGVF
eukprot:c9827_g1_i2.p1 GENE.c9827_g1_i2~~c9827_g1_i2.p1  ORF type:complete len:349 (-),score=66.76 c9827_g1_i2:233-1279(-)